MSIFGGRIKSIRKEMNMSQQEFANMLGTSKQVISRYETGQRTPKITVANEYAEKLNVSLNFLLGEDDPPIPPHPSLKPIGKGTHVPLYGRIACGAPILAIEDLEETTWMPVDVKADFALTCTGDSMINARIFEGDVVFIRRQPEVENGQIAAVIVNDEEVTLKRVYYYPEANQLMLQAENPKYPPLVYIGEDLNHVRILGKAVSFLSRVE